MLPALHIAVDLGGTHVRAALFDQSDHRILSHARNDTPKTEDPEVVLRAILATVQQVLPPERGALRGVAIGAPGPLDPFEGVVISAPNIPSWKNVPLRDWLQRELNCRVSIGNDANLAALGEWRFGAARGTQDVLYLTISTGIGGGVITGGRLILGARGLAAELGHVTVDPDGPLCGCGQRGHLEAVASGPAIARSAREALQAQPGPSLLRDLVGPDLVSLTAEVVAAAAAQGDPLSNALLAKAGNYIGRAIADFLAMFNPAVVVLGGGVSQSGDLLLDPVRQAVWANAMSPSYLRGLRILQAALGDDVGLYGAYALSLGSDSPVPATLPRPATEPEIP